VRVLRDHSRWCCRSLDLIVFPFLFFSRMGIRFSCHLFFPTVRPIGFFVFPVVRWTRVSVIKRTVIPDRSYFSVQRDPFPLSRTRSLFVHLTKERLFSRYPFFPCSATRRRLFFLCRRLPPCLRRYGEVPFLAPFFLEAQ